jgi:hypothetical protein
MMPAKAFQQLQQHLGKLKTKEHFVDVRTPGEFKGLYLTPKTSHLISFQLNLS